ncbi:MAG TPA: HEAT repeat domain-containing protein [Actinomycetota bacterium]|nr:HEAT repeat domain-containing protein [Actinomycetota bacterium]
MTASDQRTEPVYEIDLRDLASEDDGPTRVTVPDVDEEPERHKPAALADLEHPAAAVRLEALSGLTQHPQAIPIVAVTARLRDPEPAVRRAAVEALEATGDERGLLLLLDVMEDPVEDLRRSAVDALRRRRSPDLLALLRKELGVVSRADVAARALALLSEGRLVGAERGTTERRDPPHHASSKDLASLLEQLGHPLPERRRIACERLGFMRARSAVAPLAERLADPERGTRIKAADALAQIGDDGALESLERSHASEPDPGVALAIERAIAALSTRR